mmetsp:Transcript_10191/g.15648  ORF Transcript_10191/g.15648 Transcript_10191/m.15648 type:complete len:527 (-) Transcript_10191:826-2406(-)
MLRYLITTLLLISNVAAQTVCESSKSRCCTSFAPHNTYHPLFSDIILESGLFGGIIEQSNETCTSIQEIQGFSSSSPLVGSDVTICGAFVTRVVRNGFFIQEIAPANSDASSGIFVFKSGSFKDSLSEGLKINVSGEVKEYFGETQISMASAETLFDDEAKNILEPIVLRLPIESSTEFEKYEGMLVTVVPNEGNDIVVSEYYNFDRFGEVVVCSASTEAGRLYQFSEKESPDVTAYKAHLGMLSRSCLTIDDNNGSQNPNPALFGSIYAIDSTNYLRGGSVVNVLQGPLWYSFGKWRVATLKETDLLVDVTSNPRENAPTVTGDLIIANTNLLNFFTTFGSRGAENQDEYDRQAAKTIRALSEIDADIIGVQELENVSGNGAASTFAKLLNEAMPGRKYTFASIVAGYDKIGPDVIKVDILFDEAKLYLIGSALLTDDIVDPALLSASSTGSIFNGQSRVPIAATFGVRGKDEVLTVCVNHFKSKGDFDGNASGLDDDLGDGAAHFNLMRTLSAKALVSWLDSYP